MARAEVEASRLGFRFPPPELELDQASLAEGGNPVVVIQRLTEADPGLSLIHISEPTRPCLSSRMPSSA